MRHSKLKYLDLESLRQIVLLSNTPAYLYKHFRISVSLRGFAQACSVDDLDDILSSLRQRKRKTGNYAVTLYAVAVALSFKEYSKVRPLLGELGRFDAKWIHQIKQLVSDSLTVTQIQTFDLDFQGSNIAHTESSPTVVITKGSEPKISMRSL